MKDRIKAVRKAVRLSQKDFGEKIGVSFTAVSKFEVGVNNPSERTVMLICREFNVNRDWLETGEGEMFLPPDEDEEIIDRILCAQDRKSRIVAAILKGIVKTPGGWEALEEAVRAIYKELEKVDEDK